MVAILDGLTIKTEADFHREIKSLLGFPDYYGENLNALWDCITTMDTHLILVWENYAEGHLTLGDWALRAMKIFKDAENELNNFRVYYT